MVLAVLSGSAFAADLPSTKEAPTFVPPPPAMSWSGFYVGVSGGYGRSVTDSTVYAEAVNRLNSTNPTITTSAVQGFDKSGGFGGGQIGYNFQRGQFVFGLETDIQGSDVRGNASATTTAVSTEVFPGFCGGFHGCFNGGGFHSGSTFTTAVSSNTYRDSGLDWFGAVRGRLGYAIGNALIYATGGFAYGGVSGKASTTLLTADGFPPSAHTYAVDAGATLTGYAVGAGLEYALTPTWSFKAEYQYIDLGGPAHGFVGYHDYIGSPFGPVEVRARGYYGIEQNFNTIRLGLNYKFGTPESFVAKY